MKSRSAAALISASALALTLAAAAPADARPKGQRGAPSPQQFEKHMDRLEKGVKTKLAPKLGVDEATGQQLADILVDAAREQRAAKQRVHQERKKLKGLLEQNAGAAALDTQLAALDAAMEAVPPRHDVFDETRRILNPEQQAKFVLAAPKIMRKLKHKRRHMRNQGLGAN